ncbi:MAG: cupin domain-containing protein [Planctomycetota bacterium]|nr:cupin domain-containing protein [Planctomycetota bacterium]MDA1179126.1 cupin domain-containing protein [Planctomycetota bacterium]
MNSLLQDLPTDLTEEVIEVLVESGQVRIERIVSYGHCSPEGYWYDQPCAEWVTVVKGAGRLLLEGDPTPIEMRSGDYLLIPARKRHRVEWTTELEPTVWLAIHFSEAPSDESVL